MAKDTQRDKARATFGKTFFENSKAQANPKNSMAALQARANARPIPTFKVGGVVKKADGGRAGKDFTKPMMEAAARAAKKGTPVMKNGGVTAERLTERVKAGNYKDGGKAESRYDRKMADIEKDFRIAIAKGKDADVAKAKMNQRIADAKDDLAKATKQDRTATKAAEKAAERELTMTRRYGAAKPSETMKDKPIAAPKAMSDAESAAISALKPAAGLSAVSKTPAAKAVAPTRKPAAVPPRMQGRVAPQQRVSAPQQRVGAAQPPENKDTKEIVVVGKKPAAQEKRTYSSAESRQRAGRMIGDAVSAPFKAVAKYNPLSLAASAIFDGKPSSPSAPAAEKKRTPQQQDRKADYLKRAAAERAAGREGNAKFYEREASYLNKGGKVGKYAAGGAGKVRKGMMKGK